MRSAANLDAPAEPILSRLSTSVARQGIRILQGEVLEAIAAGQRLASIGVLICRRAEALMPGTICAIMAVDREGRLRTAAAPGLPTASLPESSEHRDGLDPSPANARAMPAGLRLRACWPHTVRAHDGRVIGTFALYRRTDRPPGRRRQRIVQSCLQLCALTIEHEALLVRLERADERLNVVLSNICQGLCFFDGDQRLIMANSRYAEIYDIPPRLIRPGMSLREVVDLRFASGSGPAMARDEYLHWRDAVQVATDPSDSIAELANGKSIAIHHRPMPDGGWVSTHEDITQRRGAEARIVYLASHDALTGLPNRTMFHERLEQAVALSGRGRNCSVLCLDLDRFKKVNDTFGHPIGDRLLIAVAQRLQACVRNVDTVTRLGGDEFAILLVDIERSPTAALARRIVQMVARPYDLDEHRLVIGLSLGIAVTPTDGNSPEMLLKHADMALYRAKREQPGSHRFFTAETKPDHARA